nr:histidine kinase dimerization/phospho-acceptor domain-containing protein [Sphingobium sp. BYY-5]
MQTVLAAENRTGLSAVTLWRQCVDLLAQHDRADGASIEAQERAGLLDRLTDLRPELTEAQRIATVVELGRRLRSATLVVFFAGDRPSIAAAAMARAELPDAAWADLLPKLTPTARGVLRGRRDMGPKTRQGLEAFGSADLVLTTGRQDMVGDAAMLLTGEMALKQDVSTPEMRSATITPLRPPARDEDQIRNLVDRIAQFTSTRRSMAETAPVSLPEADAAVVHPFAFETDADGVILWIDRGPRAALIGLSLGEAALEGGSGPDGHVAGAFARRSAFRNGRFTIVGGAVAGEWRISATPFFDPRSGRFQGYRGQARAPYLHEVAAQPAPAPTAVTGLSADSLRQLVHELRTPLNAILGFAEIIEQELFGPAGDGYRDMAGKIAVDARHLLAAFDDLDLAARVSRGEDGAALCLVDPRQLVTQIAARFREQGRVALSPVEIAMTPELPPLLIDPVQGERMVQHLFRTMISVAPAGEVLTGACWLRPDGARARIILAVDRPSSLIGLDEAQLLDPAYGVDGDRVDGPLLGLGFSLRLIRSLATTCGGDLEIGETRIMLILPAAVTAREVADIG